MRAWGLALLGITLHSTVQAAEKRAFDIPAGTG
jgi:hypothetical protein